MSFTVVAMYKFVRIEEPNHVRTCIQSICSRFDILGALITAKEGINGTVAGPTDNIPPFLVDLRKLVPIEDHEMKFSKANINPFYRMRTIVKPEIITMGCSVEEADPEKAKGTYVEPDAWNDLVNDPDVLVIDTRNDYEIELGTFENAVNPNCISFRDFPQYVTEKLDKSRHKKVAMFCTGGVRCEKASSYMLNKGFEEVYHLKGGILKYLETIPPEKSTWKGECYVFDQRVSVKHGLEPGTYILCRSCRHPLHIPDDIEDEYYEEGVTCHYCYHQLSDSQKESSRARHKQMMIAKEKNIKHLGYIKQKNANKNNNNSHNENDTTKNNNKNNNNEQLLDVTKVDIT